MFQLHPRPFTRKLVDKWLEKAGLLAWPANAPSRFTTVAWRASALFSGLYSYGDSTGIAPVSLLILPSAGAGAGTLSGCKHTGMKEIEKRKLRVGYNLLCQYFYRLSDWLVVNAHLNVSVDSPVEELKSCLHLLTEKYPTMTMIPGVTVQKNSEGRITHVTIDVEQQKELAKPVLEKIADGKSGFRERFAKGLTVEEAREDMINHLKGLYLAH